MLPDYIQSEIDTVPPGPQQQDIKNWIIANWNYQQKMNETNNPDIETTSRNPYKTYTQSPLDIDNSIVSQESINPNSDLNTNINSKAPAYFMGGPEMPEAVKQFYNEKQKFDELKGASFEQQQALWDKEHQQPTNQNMSTPDADQPTSEGVQPNKQSWFGNALDKTADKVVAEDQPKFLQPQQQPDQTSVGVSKKSYGPGAGSGISGTIAELQKLADQQKADALQQPKDLEGIYAAQKVALTNEAETQKVKAKAIEEHNNQVAGFMEQHQQKLEQMQAATKIKVEEQMKSIEAMQKEIADTKFDPDAWLTKASQGTKIHFGIEVFSAIIGGALSGLMVNSVKDPSKMTLAPGVDLFEKYSRQQIELQKMELQKKQGLVASKQNLLGQYMQAGANEQQAEVLTMNTYINAAQHKLQSIQSQYKSQELSDGLDKAINDLEMKKQTGLNNLKQQTYTRLSDTYSRKLDAQYKQGMLGLEYQKMQLMNASKGALPDSQKPIYGLDVADPNSLTKSGRLKSIEAVQNYGNVKGLLDRAIALRKTYDSETGWGSVKAEMDSISTQLKMALKNVYQLGVLSDSDMKLLDKTVNDISEYGYAADRLRAVDSTVRQRLNVFVRPHGYNPNPEQLSKLTQTSNQTETKLQDSAK